MIFCVCVCDCSSKTPMNKSIYFLAEEIKDQFQTVSLSKYLNLEKQLTFICVTYFFTGAKIITELLWGCSDLYEVITDQPEAPILQTARIANDGSIFKSPRESRTLPNNNHGAVSGQLHPCRS